VKWSASAPVGNPNVSSLNKGFWIYTWLTGISPYQAIYQTFCDYVRRFNGGAASLLIFHEAIPCARSPALVQIALHEMPITGTIRPQELQQL